MSNLVGDTSHLHLTKLNFNAVRQLTGKEGAFSFLLSEADGFSQLAQCRASVRIVSDSLSVKVIGPASASVAVDAYVAVIPTGRGAVPTEPCELLTVGGSAHVQHSLYVGSRAERLGFAVEAAHQIKPTPLVGSAPQVVGYYEVVGGSATSVVHVVISGQIEVDGVGYIQTW